MDVYRHYKGKDYALLHTARHTETLEEYVVYQALYGAGEIWIRPKAMFFETITVDGVERPRFSKVTS